MSLLLARALVFVAAAAVLVLEILAGRLLAPYLGVSLEVFTGIIGVILAGISVGAWLGGRAADRGTPTRLLGPLLIAGGITALASPLIVDLIGPATGPGPISIVIVTTLAFFAPAAVLSAVPPVVIKIRLASLDQTGSVVGSYSAIGTAGAIFGTFVTGFVLIAAFPTRPIVIALGVVLTIAGMAIWASRRAWATVGSLILVALLSGLLMLLDGPCDYETAYHCAQVVEDPLRESGRYLVLDRANHSYVDLEDPAHLEFRYIRVMADLIEVESPPGALDVLSIGGGGFTFPGYLDATRPGTDHLILEIDAKLIEVGREDLGLENEERVIVGDARRSIDVVPDASVHLVIGDAFSGLTVPWHLTTVEFVEEVSDRLRPDGIYTLNVIDYRDKDFVRSALATLDLVFDHVAVLAPPTYIHGDRGGNFVLVGSDGQIDMRAVEDAISARAGIEIGVADSGLRDFIAGASPLLDDFAPVDQMIGRP